MEVNRENCPATSHGRYTDYNKHGCRCDDAKENKRLAVKRWRVARERGRPHLVPVIGCTRRIQALGCIGYSRSHILDLLGYTVSKGAAHGGYQNGGTAYRQPMVTRRNFDKLARLYKKLEHTTGPDTRMMAYARNRGWYPPICWDDIDNPEARPHPTREMYARDVEEAWTEQRRRKVKEVNDRQAAKRKERQDARAADRRREINRQSYARTKSRQKEAA